MIEGGKLAGVIGDTGRSRQRVERIGLVVRLARVRKAGVLSVKVVPGFQIGHRSYPVRSWGTPGPTFMALDDTDMLALLLG